MGDSKIAAPAMAAVTAGVQRQEQPVPEEIYQSLYALYLQLKGLFEETPAKEN